MIAICGQELLEKFELTKRVKRKMPVHKNMVRWLSLGSGRLRTNARRTSNVESDQVRLVDLVKDNDVNPFDF